MSRHKVREALENELLLQQLADELTACGKSQTARALLDVIERAGRASCLRVGEPDALTAQFAAGERRGIERVAETLERQVKEMEAGQAPLRAEVARVDACIRGSEHAALLARALLKDGAS